MKTPPQSPGDVDPTEIDAPTRGANAVILFVVRR